MSLLTHSVVQRQLYFLSNGLGHDEAYDKARKEFYALRQEEQIERRIAEEEARYVGAYFGKSFLHVGMELEDEQYEAWKRWASKQIDIVKAEQNAAYTSYGTEEETTEDDLDLLADAADEPAPPPS